MARLCDLPTKSRRKFNAAEYHSSSFININGSNATYIILLACRNIHIMLAVRNEAAGKVGFSSLGPASFAPSVTDNLKMKT